jgi:molybdate transport system substrate-binding protein
MKMRVRPLAILGLLSVGLVAALGITSPQARADEKPLTIFAAASLKNALDDVAQEWVAAGHAKPLISYAASGPLAKQIEAGAPADLFISADLAWMDYVQKKSLINEKSRVTLLGNRLVLVVPKTSIATITLGPNAPLAQLLGDSRLAIGDPKSVPAGKYGQQALEKLGIWASVQGKLAPADSVRSALFLVGRGEAAAGIVYQTDAAAEPNVKIVAAFPEDSHPPILYPAALVATSTNPADDAFMAFLRGTKARTAFEHQGFDVVAGPATN